MDHKDAQNLAAMGMRLIEISVPHCTVEDLVRLSSNISLLQAKMLQRIAAVGGVQTQSETKPKRRGRPPKAQAEAPKAQSGKDDDIAMELAKIEMNDAAWLVKKLGEKSQRPRSTLKKLINAGKTTMDALTELLESR